MASKAMKLTAGGTLLVFGAGLSGHVYSLSQTPYQDDQPEAFAVVASTSSAGVVVIQDTISGDEIKLPRFAGVTVIKST
jgi:hypothetical protein